ncbi:MAG: antibiotic biosynthesis monooxygenase [Candidatus Dormibacteraeota bacterium]|nr:antibiotic biosynthesis monooxygenase [Candidatus Dormibacteraeota bacterium]
MYARMTNVRLDPDRLDQVIAAYEQKVVGVVRQLPGYVGAVLDVDRDTGEGWGLIYWESLAALNASEEESSRIRPGASASAGVSIVDVERYEMVISERRAGGSRSGAAARVNELYAPPEKLDDAIAVIREATPRILEQKGCLGLVMGVNRMTGRAFAASIWETAADREASEEAVAGTRREASQVAGVQPKIVRPEVAFVEMKQPARTG